MCTAVTLQTKDSYFGRNLDFEHDFGERVVITPRNYPFPFRFANNLSKHFAIIGMAVVDNAYPLYFDATNECGLSMAGLYFPGNAVYLPPKDGVDNITPFEFIPWILGQCSNLKQAEAMLEHVHLVDVPYSSEYPLSPLHWLIAYKGHALVAEPIASGLRIHKNPFGVLTNNPPFEYHMHNLCNYISVTRDEPSNRFAPEYPLLPYSRGMGGIGLPGDLSSASRFVRVAFVKANSVCGTSETESVSQFFHVLSSVEQQQGCARVGTQFEKTIYASCCNTDKGIYYYKTYHNAQITGICMHHTDLDEKRLCQYPLRAAQHLYFEN